MHIRLIDLAKLRNRHIQTLRVVYFTPPPLTRQRDNMGYHSVLRITDTIWSVGYTKSVDSLTIKHSEVYV